MKNKKKVELKFKFNLGKIIIVALLILFIAPFFLALLQEGIDQGKIDVSQGLSDIKNGLIEEVEVEDERLTFKYKNEDVKIAIKESGISFPELLEAYQIDPATISYRVVDNTLIRLVGEIASILLPLILMAAFFYFLIKMQSRGAQDIFSFGRSKARLFAKGKQSVNFADVAGVDDAKKELEEVVDFLKNPVKYRKIGARTPKGVILVGPAGVGKTLLAKAVAGEAGVPFFSMAGSEFMEMLVGVGASRVRDLFANAKAAAPSIIFIDEIDAIGRQRGRGIMGGHDEREQTLNQILVEMDGFTPNDNVIVLAATNRGDLLDPALLRPGRFDRRVLLDMPDKEGRVAILKIHAKGKKFKKSIDWEKVADRTVGFSGADLENMLNEAAILAAREDKKEIALEDIEEAATKVKLGPAKKRLQSEEDRKITAYHEGGHAITAHFLEKTDPVQRVSIVARGASLGHTFIPPAADRTHETRSQLKEQITAMLGGRAAEELIFGEMTAGAANDIEKATELARAMVIELGMSSLGPINFSTQLDEESQKRLFMGENVVSEDTQKQIDKEIRLLMNQAYKKALEIIKKNKKTLDIIAKELLEKETLSREEFERIVGRKKRL